MLLQLSSDRGHVNESKTMILFCVYQLIKKEKRLITSKVSEGQENSVVWGKVGG